MIRISELLSSASTVYSVHALMTELVSGKIVMLQLPDEDFIKGKEKWEGDPQIDTVLTLLTPGMMGTISGLCEGCGTKRGELVREVGEELDGLPHRLIKSVEDCIGEPLENWSLSQTLQVRAGRATMIYGTTLPLIIPDRLVAELERELCSCGRKLVRGNPSELLVNYCLRPFSQTLLRMYLENMQ
jgi:hypothetical protein